MNPITEANIKKLTDAYAKKWYRRLVEEGYSPDIDEIESEIGWALANSIRNWRPNRQVKFTTYAISAIRNAMFSLRKRMNKRSFEVPMAEYVGEYRQDYETGVCIRDVLAKFDSLTRLVAVEAMHPSDKVMKAHKIIDARNDRLPADQRKPDDARNFSMAMQMVYGIRRMDVYNTLMFIRKATKEMLQ